ncbi:MAG: 50S ribosomal protein L18 [Holosporales bacterium]|jgi:large subunit ribosomal protein L18|nr:50S ribosomal protein L18 [Holosporales bacterium]
MKTSIQLREIRKSRQRFKVSASLKGKYRLLVHRTNNHMYAQILDESGKNTIIHVSTLSKDIKDKVKSGGNKEAAICVGKAVALKAKEKNISSVVFDRSGFLYHGRIKVLADSARESGLNF